MIHKQVQILLGSFSNQITAWNLNVDGSVDFVGKVNDQNNVSPSWIINSGINYQDQRIIYATNETDSFGNNYSGAVVSYILNSTKSNDEHQSVDQISVSYLNEISSNGAHPTHLCSFNNSIEEFLVVSNYSSGSFSMMPRDRNGSLDSSRLTVNHSNMCGINSELSLNETKTDPKSKVSHVHQVLRLNDSTIAVVDSGLNKIFHYEIQQIFSNSSFIKVEEEKISSLEYSDNLDIEYFGDRFKSILIKCSEQTIVEFPEGSGPRHLVLHPTAELAYTICELSSEIITLQYNREKGLISRFDYLQNHDGSIMDSESEDISAISSNNGTLDRISTLRDDETSKDMVAGEVGTYERIL